MRIKSFLITVILATSILSFGAGANAQSVDVQTLIAKIQNQIAQLQAQIAQLQSQGSTTIQTWCHNFNKNFGLGTPNNNQETEQLQNAFEKEKIYTAMGNSGDFDEYLASAVSEFQEKYASEILAPYGLLRGTGYVGASTRKKLNALHGCNTTLDQTHAITPTPNQTPTLTPTPRPNSIPDTNLTPSTNSTPTPTPVLVPAPTPISISTPATAPPTTTIINPPSNTIIALKCLYKAINGSTSSKLSTIVDISYSLPTQPAIFKLGNLPDDFVSPRVIYRNVLGSGTISTRLVDINNKSLFQPYDENFANPELANPHQTTPHIVTFNGLPTSGTFRLGISDNYGDDYTSIIKYVGGDQKQTEQNILNALTTLRDSRPSQMVKITVTAHSTTEFEIDYHHTSSEYNFARDYSFPIELDKNYSLVGGSTPSITITAPATYVAWQNARVRLTAGITGNNISQSLTSVSYDVIYNKKNGGYGQTTLRPVTDISTTGWVADPPIASCLSSSTYLVPNINDQLLASISDAIARIAEIIREILK